MIEQKIAHISSDAPRLPGILTLCRCAALFMLTKLRKNLLQSKNDSTVLPGPLGTAVSRRERRRMLRVETTTEQRREGLLGV